MTTKTKAKPKANKKSTPKKKADVAGALVALERALPVAGAAKDDVRTAIECLGGKLPAPPMPAPGELLVD